MLASLQGHLETVQVSHRLFTLTSLTNSRQVLLDNGADVDAADANGCTALFLATYVDRTDIVKVSVAMSPRFRYVSGRQALLDSGAAVDTALEGDATPLQFAAIVGDAQIVKVPSRSPPVFLFLQPSSTGSPPSRRTG